jgi:tetratricopeptide (TPR) repeat protein
MPLMNRGGASLVLVVGVLSLSASVRAGDPSVKEHYRRGVAEYGLGNYAEAAVEYEKAFNIDPQPALLYDAAQAHRLAGNKPRALQLYQSYLSLFGDRVQNREEVSSRILQLKRAIAAEQQSKPVAPPPPAPSPSPRSSAQASATPAPPTPPADSPSPTPSPSASPPPPSPPPVVVAKHAAEPAPAPFMPEPAPRERSRSKRGLAIGLGVTAGVLVVAGALVLGLELGQRDPVPTFGAVAPK